MIEIWKEHVGTVRAFLLIIDVPMPSLIGLSIRLVFSYHKVFGLISKFHNENNVASLPPQIILFEHRLELDGGKFCDGFISLSQRFTRQSRVKGEGARGGGAFDLRCVSSRRRNG